MSATSSSPRSRGRLVDLATALAVCVLLVVMVLMPAQETLPYHALFLWLTVVYGYRVWPIAPTLAVIGVVTLSTGAIFVDRWSSDLIETPELFEIGLMPALLLAMVWHARRRQRAEQATAAMAADLQRVLERERAFLSDSSHAIRTPVTIARGHVDLLIPQLDGIAREDARVVLRQLTRMERLSARLLSLAHLQRGDVLVRRPLVVDEFVEEVAHAWRPTDRAWELSVGSGATLQADPEWLHMALDALIENALKHTDPGDSVAISCRRQGSTVLIAVDDSGPGVPLADRPHVFERFWHRRSGGRMNGSGLGLAMVRAVAEAHGGRADVGQSIAGGARFTLELPVMSPRAAVPEKVSL
jgi:signal transduction histidine kinase